MDKTTQWLIRITCLAILGGGIGGAIYISLKGRGEPEKIANSCPPSFAYVGEGNCRRFHCTDIGKEVSMLNRKHVCKRPALAFLRLRFVWTSNLFSNNISEPAFYTPTCPNREPGLGWGSTCAEDKGLLPEKVSKKKVKKDVNSGSVNINCNSPVWKNKPICN